MAFPAHRGGRGEGSPLPATCCSILTTRGCFHNPTRDRGRVVGEATLASAVGPPGNSQWPSGVANNAIGCRLAIDGVALRPARGRTRAIGPPPSAFPDPATWSVRMRRTVVPLPTAVRCAAARGARGRTWLDRRAGARRPTSPLFRTRQHERPSRQAGRYRAPSAMLRRRRFAAALAQLPDAFGQLGQRAALREPQYQGPQGSARPVPPARRRLACGVRPRTRSTGSSFPRLGLRKTSTSG